MQIFYCPRCAVQNPASAQFCSQCGLQFVPVATAPLPQKKKSNVLPILLLVLIAPGAICVSFGVSVGVLNTANRQSQPVASTSGPTNQQSTKLATPTPAPKGLVLIKSKWHKGGFDTVAIWNVTIKNESDRPLGDIKFRTVYESESGNTVTKGGVDSLLGKDTIEKVVPAKSTRTFEVNDGFVSDEAERGDFEIVSWREVEK